MSSNKLQIMKIMLRLSFFKILNKLCSSFDIFVFFWWNNWDLHKTRFQTDIYKSSNFWCLKPDSWLSLGFCLCLSLENCFLTQTFSYPWRVFVTNLCSDLLLLKSFRVMSGELRQIPLIQHRTCSRYETWAQMQAFKTMPVIPTPSVANLVSLHNVAPLRQPSHYSSPQPNPDLGIDDMTSLCSACSHG